MLSVLSDPTYRRLFAAQVIALLGTGLATVALGLLAFDLSGGDAAMVLALILTVKMVAYVTIAPLAGALAERVPRRPLLVVLDLIRAGAALFLPFASSVADVLILIAILQSASAAFTPTFQATIPDILTEEERYTRALSLSRLAYDLEAIVSPLLAAVLLLFLSHNALFAGTVLGFLCSAGLVLGTRLPEPEQAPEEPFLQRTMQGLRIFRDTARLRGLMALNLAAAAGGAMVLVNTVVLVKDRLALGDSALALTMAGFGCGSMLMALALPKLLDRGGYDRRVMLSGAGLLALVMGALGLLTATFGPIWAILLLGWGVAGLGFSAIQTPAGRLLRRSSEPPDRPAVFAAQFALSHLCWLGTYPLAGWLMTAFGATTAFLVLGTITAMAAGLALWLWPKP